MSSNGDSAICAFFTAVTVLVRPGPAVTAATPTVPGEGRETHKVTEGTRSPE